MRGAFGGERFPRSRHAFELLAVLRVSDLMRDFSAFNRIFQKVQAFAHRLPRVSFLVARDWDPNILVCIFARALQDARRPQKSAAQLGREGRTTLRVGFSRHWQP
jgi:hypothetical protein